MIRCDIVNGLISLTNPPAFLGCSPGNRPIWSQPIFLPYLSEKWKNRNRRLGSWTPFPLLPLPLLFLSPPFPLLLPSLSSSSALPFLFFSPSLLFFSPSSTLLLPSLYSSSPLPHPPSFPLLNPTPPPPTPILSLYIHTYYFSQIRTRIMLLIGLVHQHLLSMLLYLP